MIGEAHDWMDRNDPRMARWPSIRDGMNYRLCFRCGVVERRDGLNKSCSGKMPRITLRVETSKPSRVGR